MSTQLIRAIENSLQKLDWDRISQDHTGTFDEAEEGLHPTNALVLNIVKEWAIGNRPPHFDLKGLGQKLFGNTKQIYISMEHLHEIYRAIEAASVPFQKIDAKKAEDRNNR